MQRTKRILVLVLAVLMLATAVPFAAMVSLAADINRDDLVWGDEAGITRAQWLHDLVVVFEVTVGIESYPDNYFSDLTEEHPYYEDILMAVEYGIVDVEAGFPLEPDALVTREFAASTLNYCLGYQLAEGAEYTFADSAACGNPASAQVALNRNWVQLIDGNFAPNTAVTSAEVRLMLEDAAAVLEKAIIDENHENVFEFQDDVVVIPDGTEATVVSDTTVEIENCPVTLSANQKFAVYFGGIPRVYRAQSVSVSGTKTTVTVAEVDLNEAFENIDAQGTTGIEGMEITPMEGVEVSIDKKIDPASTFAIKWLDTIKATDQFQIIPGVTADVTVEITSPKIDYAITGSRAYAILGGETEVTYTVEANLLELNGKRTSIPLYKCGVPGVGGFTVSVEFDLSGGVTGTTTGYLTVGVECVYGEDVRLVRNFVQHQTSINAHASAAVGLKASLGITDLPCLKAFVYAEVGVTGKVKASVYGDGKLPLGCTHFSAYLYANAGAEGSAEFLLWKKVINLEKTIFGESNSPVRVVHHYEDGDEVASCTRSGNHSYGNPGNYFTPVTSPQGGSGWSDANQSHGLNKDGIRVPIFNYEINDDGITITNYIGSSWTVQIPSQIDGFSVTAIGDYAFCDKNLARGVIPDTVRTIGKHAFENCYYLKTVVMSKNLEEIDYAAFRNCISLEEIFLPKTLKVAGAFGNNENYGIFHGCTKLKTVTLEEGMPAVPSNLFMGAAGLNSVTIPSTATYIGEGAFDQCTGLQYIEIPGAVTKINSNAFYGCISLTKVTMADSVTEISAGAFDGCSKLTEVKLSNNLQKLDYAAFRNCISLEEIFLPKTLKVAGAFGNNENYGIFHGCTKLKTVTMEEGMPAVPSNLFMGAASLNSVTIPSTATYIGEGAFDRCTGLQYIEIPGAVTKINSNAFYGCTSLTKVTIADSVTEISAGAFDGCSKLTEIKLSSNLQKLDYAAFRNCISLEEIFLPKTLEVAGAFGNNETYGIFHGCMKLKTVTMEEGMPAVPSNLFMGAAGLNSVTIPSTATYIGEGAFDRCTGLQYVEIPGAVTKINSNAFYGCISLTKVTMADSVTEISAGAFEGCSKLTEVKLSGNLQKLDYAAFRDCSLLPEITLPKTLQICGTFGNNTSYGIFSGCHSLKTVNLEEGMSVIPANILMGCEGVTSITLPESASKIANNAFSGASLTSFTLPASVTSVGSGAFKDCTALTEFIWNEAATQIEDETFYGCTALANITIPDTVTKIGGYAFYDCDALVEIDLPESLTCIGERAFQYCDGLVTIVLPKSVTMLERLAFFECNDLTAVDTGDGEMTISDQAFYNCDALTTVRVGNGVKSIGYSAFADCDALVSVDIGDSVTSIGNSIFEHCNVLTDVKLGSSLTAIPNYAFKQCAMLEEITIPYNVTTIGIEAFNASPKLVKIVLPKGLTLIGNNALSYANTTVVYGVVGTYAETWAANNGFQFESYTVHATQAQLNKHELILGRNASEKLNLSVTPADFTDDVSWKSSDPTVATVSADGTVKGVGVGTTTIKVTVGDVSASCKVTVRQLVTSITLNASNVTLEALQTKQLTATTYPNDVSDKTVVWTSSNEEVATVDENGLVTALSKGTATITATANDGGGAYRSCNVTVTNNAYVVTDPTKLESPHNYPVNCTDVWVYTDAGQSGLAVTFDALTELEDGFDYLFLYDGTGNQVGKYTGKSLAGQTIQITGDTVKLQLKSDASGTAWGFKVTKVEAVAAVEPVKIVTQPKNVWVKNGEKAKVELEATGDGLTYAWYYKSASSNSFTLDSGVKGNSYTVTMTAARANRQVYCVVTDQYGNKATSDTVKMGMAASVLTQPKTTYTKLNDTAKVTVKAGGEGLTYTWYFKNAGSSKYTKSSVTSATYSAKMTSTTKDRQVYCVVKDKYGNTVKTSVVPLRMAASIATQPKTTYTKLNGTAKVTVKASGDGLTYTWYFKNAGASKFSKSSVTSATYSAKMTDKVKNRQVYCVVKDKYGNEVKTSTVYLRQAASIVTQPKTTYTKLNGTAKVTVKASGDGLTYTWYFKNAGASKFSKSSITSATYSTKMTSTQKNRQVYCVVKDKYGNTVKTTTVYLRQAASIVTQPKTTYTKLGGTAKVTVKASGDGLTYTWYFKNAGSTKFTKSSVTSATYSTKMTSTTKDRQVYCVVKDKYGNTVKTETVRLRMAASISKQPVSVTAAKGAKATVKLTAKGDGLTYKWYYKDAGSKTFKLTTSFKSSTYSLTMSKSNSGRQVYCVVTDKYGNSVKSNVVTLKMK